MTVERLASLKYPPQIFHRLVVPGHGAKVTLRHHSRHVFLGLRLYPHGVAMRKEIVKSLLFGHHASSHRKHRAFIFIQHSFQRALFDRPITGLPVKRKDFRERHSRILLNFAIHLDEGHLALAGQLGPQRCLTGSAQPNQRDAHSSHLFFGAEVTHQPEHHIFQAMIWETLEESLN